MAVAFVEIFEVLVEIAVVFQPIFANSVSSPVIFDVEILPISASTIEPSTIFEESTEFAASSVASGEAVYLLLFHFKTSPLAGLLASTSEIFLMKDEDLFICDQL